MTSQLPTSVRSDIAAIVLCGGMATRMGADKADLKIGHQTMLEHVCCTLLRIAGQVVVVAAADQAVNVSHSRIRIVRDEFPAEGPLAGFLTGLRSLKSEASEHGGQVSAVWLSACDTPLVPETVVEKTCDCLNSSQAQVVTIVNQGQNNPLIAAYRIDVLPAVELAFDKGERSMNRLLQNLDTRRLPSSEVLDDTRLLLNVNRPEELSLARDLMNSLGESI